MYNELIPNNVQLRKTVYIDNCAYCTLLKLTHYEYAQVKYTKTGNVQWIEDVDDFLYKLRLNTPDTQTVYIKGTQLP